MSTSDVAALPDVQGLADARNVPIARVGVKNLRFPIKVRDRGQIAQHTVATIDMSVAVPHHLKGTHMSRFIELLNEHDGEISAGALPHLMDAMLSRLDAETAHLSVSFPYFMKKAAPVTGIAGFMSYDCSFDTSRGALNDFVLTVNVPVTTLCPCSKEISARGAHNQRSLVRVETRFSGELWIEDVITLVEDSASSELYPILKRADERAVTERAYDNPRFVEDLVREVTLRLREVEAISWFRVEVVNFESIHEHDAFAMVVEEASSL